MSLEKRLKQITPLDPTPHCSVCGHTIIRPRGVLDSPWVVVGDAPTDYEMRMGEGWLGQAMELMRREMITAGVPYHKLMFTYLLGHPNAGESCIDQARLDFFRTMKSKKAILLTGDNCISILTSVTTGVMSISSLNISKMMIVDMSPTRCIAMPSILTAFTQGIGEIRLALQRFKEAM